MSNRTAIIVGHRGQDGRILLQQLRKQMVNVCGIDRNIIEEMGCNPISNRPVSLENAADVARLLRCVNPDEIYYLAAYHRSSQGFSSCEGLGGDFREGIKVNVEGVVNFLEGMQAYCPQSRLFYAASSLIFGECTAIERQTEMTPWKPSCEYGLMKALGMQVCKLYRNNCGLYASCGILYNHESIYRTAEFLSKKVIATAHNIKAGSEGKLVIGDLEAVVDWSYAPDFIDAFQRILRLDRPDDYIVASGEGHSVREFIEIAFSHLGLDWREYVTEAPQVLHRSKSVRIGDPHKLRNKTGWAPSMGFAEMVRRLVDEANTRSLHCG